MRRLTQDDITGALGPVDDIIIAEIIGTGATLGEWAEAQAWLANDEPLMNAGRPLATGRVREIIDILAELDANDDEEKEAGRVLSET